MKRPRAIIVHGGAGGGKFAAGDRRYQELLSALEAGMSQMRNGSSLDAVEAAVRSMEDSGAFNAGRGACLTAHGEVELDAAVMCGRDLRGAGVGICTCTYHPVSLARFVMEKTDHVLIAGDYCKSLARAAGMEIEKPIASKEAVRKYSSLKMQLGKTHSRNSAVLKAIERCNTVGAVALDSDGIPSAAVSTGGMWLKLPGRIGDSAILGAGIYADERVGAACATGAGEEIIRTALSWSACWYMRESDAMDAARRTISLVSRRSGRCTAGIVTVDLKGRVGFSYNTAAMGRAWFDPVRGRPLGQV
jgi:beta-aspartyl-peptidase (threonine type)